MKQSAERPGRRRIAGGRRLGQQLLTQSQRIWRDEEHFHRDRFKLQEIDFPQCMNKAQSRVVLASRGQRVSFARANALNAGTARRREKEAGDLPFFQRSRPDGKRDLANV